MILALTLAALIMIVALHHVLARSAESATSARAHQIAGIVASEGLAGVEPSLLNAAQNVAVIQIVDPTGTIRLSNNANYNRPLAPPLPPGQQTTLPSTYAKDDSGEAYQASAIGVKTPDGVLTVMVGAAITPINATVLIVAILCSIVFPLIVAGMALLTYYFVGRALRPVEAIRRRVADITGGDLTQRVPVPATGDEIATLATTMNEMLGRIEEARGQQLRFVNDASHELNSPLTTLVGLLDLARVKGQPIDPDTVDVVMMPEAMRLQNMVADLLLLARADESGVPLRWTDVNLDEIVSSEVARLEATTDHTITVSIVPVRIRGDAEKLTRALRNIADNAARHTDDTLAFAMTHDSTTRSATITVSDNGRGIPDVDKGRITQRFVRLDTSRERTSGGSGLGLSITNEIIRAHHGSMIITDSDHAGATIGFTLPADE
ncbi:Signal transduction histidine-protein kinase ArlS [Gordonia insulae]|uniref:histidine kinase n=1 Tax=Gordonia insulae TaxID=2420509 RepID=A0A3G8JQ39_9ACTN|nr:Signal transduction histidine-protein kinase ArlS [Gordonia insulae]